MPPALIAIVTTATRLDPRRCNRVNLRNHPCTLELASIVALLNHSILLPFPSSAERVKAKMKLQLSEIGMFVLVIHNCKKIGGNFGLLFVLVLFLTAPFSRWRRI
ncbi:uncharacterized protein LOC114180646 isoform X1 [Vigna unguiculata]|uniref:uncharacterized protein LOC114180646 isoform X1 n=1 Tax=Vigna unguiculata TaxID=3917 RepID=UPI001015F9D2|nr:uncharacterized protein LOC114180646 isoform X1 [Vigna unguiculata]